MKLQTKTRARLIYTFSLFPGFLQQTHSRAGGGTDHHTEAVYSGPLQVHTSLLSLNPSLYFSSYHLFFSSWSDLPASARGIVIMTIHIISVTAGIHPRATNFVQQTLTPQFGHQLLFGRNNFQSSNFLKLTN